MIGARLFAFAIVTLLAKFTSSTVNKNLNDWLSGRWDTSSFSTGLMGSLRVSMVEPGVVVRTVYEMDNRTACPGRSTNTGHHARMVTWLVKLIWKGSVSQVQAFFWLCHVAQDSGMEDLFMAGGLLARGPKRGPRKVVEKLSRSDSEDALSESAGWLA